MSAGFPIVGERNVALTLFTDAYVIRGHVETRQRRVSDMLNQAEHNFIVLVDVVLDEYGSRAGAVRSDYAQINLGSVLFAVADASEGGAMPEMHTPKIPEQAMISIPPFRILGRIHLAPERDLRDALEELTGRFIPVTDATYWSDVVGEARTSAGMIAINHARAQILAPHREVDPWAGLDRSAGAGSGASTGSSAGAAAAAPTGGFGGAETGVPDPWGFERAGGAGAGAGGAAGGSGSAGAAVGEPDPWGPGLAQDPWGSGQTTLPDDTKG